MTKRIALALSFYKFRERLKYKCFVKKCDYKKVKEYYTSKMCSVCTFYNDKLKNEEIFECPECDIIIGRDENASRNIYFASIK